MPSVARSCDHVGENVELSDFTHMNKNPSFWKNKKIVCWPKKLLSPSPHEKKGFLRFTPLREHHETIRSFVHMFAVLDQYEVNDMFLFIGKKDQPVLFL